MGSKRRQRMKADTVKRDVAPISYRESTILQGRGRFEGSELSALSLMKSFCNRSCGFTLIEIMTVMGIMGLLVTLALPNLIRARSTSQMRICITNLNKIESVKQTWGLEHAKSLNEIPAVTDLIGPLSYLKEMPVCPSGGDYDFRSLKENATCTVAGHTL